YLLARIFVLLDRSFRIFYGTVIRSRSVLDGAGQHDGVSAGINHRSKVHQDFGPAFDSSTALYVGDGPLNIGAGGDNHALAYDKGKRGLGVHGIAIAGILGRDR